MSPSRPPNIWGQTREEAKRHRRFWVLMYAVGTPVAAALVLLIVLSLKW